MQEGHRGAEELQETMGVESIQLLHPPAAAVSVSEVSASVSAAEVAVVAIRATKEAQPGLEAQQRGRQRLRQQEL